MGRARVAPDRPPCGRARDRTGLHSRNRFAHPGRRQTPRGGRVRSVVVTGVGCVTPAGTGAEGLWSGLRSRQSPIRTLTRFDPEPYRTKIAAEIPEFHAEDHMTRKAV